MKIIISRKEAKAQGLPHYYTGKPCKRGHLSERRTDNASCLECRREYQKEYMQEHCHAYNRAAAGKAAQARYRQKAAVKEASRARQRAYIATEQGKELQRAWQEAHPHRRANADIKRKYPLAIIPLTDEEQVRVAALYRLAAGLRKRTGKRWDVDHCFPLSLGGVHHPDNLMILPAEMNREKWNKFNEESPAQLQGLFVSMMAKAIYHPHEQLCSPFHK